MICGCVIPNLIFTRKLPCYFSRFIYSLCFFSFLKFFICYYVTPVTPSLNFYIFYIFFFFHIFHLLLRYPRYYQLEFYPRKKGLTFELWLHDSHLIFSRKLWCFLFWFIYSLCFLLFLDFRFFICSYVTPITPNSNFYIFCIFLFFYIFHLLLPYPRYSQLEFYPVKKGLVFDLWLRDSQYNFHQKIAILFILIMYSLCFLLFLDFSFVTTLPPLLPI